MVADAVSRLVLFVVFCFFFPLSPNKNKTIGNYNPSRVCPLIPRSSLYFALPVLKEKKTLVNQVFDNWRHLLVAYYNFYLRPLDGHMALFFEKGRACILRWQPFDLLCLRFSLDL